MSFQKRAPSLTRVIVAAPHPIASHLLAHALESKDLLVVDCVSDPQLLASTIAKHHPDVLLASVHLKKLAEDRFFLLGSILAEYPGLACIVLLDSNDPEVVVDAFRVRAKGIFMCAERNTEMLQKCIRCVVEGQIWADSTQMNYIVSALPRAHCRDLVAKRKVPKILTPREEQVVLHLAQGLTNREIAAQMQLTENTIKNYVFHIFEKLGFSNRVEVVLYAATDMQQSSLAADHTKPATTTDKKSRSGVILQSG
jgi:DNA-binding NarL/FixJ family response regulator